MILRRWLFPFYGMKWGIGNNIQTEGQSPIRAVISELSVSRKLSGGTDWRNLLRICKKPNLQLCIKIAPFTFVNQNRVCRISNGVAKNTTKRTQI